MTPIERTIDRLQNADPAHGRHSTYIYGWTNDRRYALIVHANEHETICTIAHRDTANGIGRWETKGTPDEYLAARFPLR